WKRLMERALHATELVPFVLPLLEAPQILAAPETTILAGDLIHQYFKSFTPEQKLKIENAVWAMPDLKMARVYRVPEQQRNMLLSCIPEGERGERTSSAITKAES